jgi:ankyrin repeat protein
MAPTSNRRMLLGGLFVVVVVALVALRVITAPDEETHFVRAVQDGDVATVAAMLDTRSDLAQLEPFHGIKGGKGGTEPVLKTALWRGHTEVVRLLLDHGATPEKYPGLLVHAQNVEAAQLLIEHGADVNGHNEHGVVALHLFAGCDNTSMVEFLISRGADVNMRDGHGETPLHEAAKDGCLNAARILVAGGADIDARTERENRTPFDYAVRPVWDEEAYRMDREKIRKLREVAAYLLSCGSTYTVFDLAWLGDVERLAKQLALDPSLASARANGEPVLFAAVRGANAKTVEYLLSHGAPLDVVGRFGQTPLQVAAYIGHAGVAEVLLSHGASVDARGPWGETALHWAAFRGNADVAVILLDRGADPSIPTTGHTIDLNVTANDANPVERELKWFGILEDQLRHGGQIMHLSRLAFTAGDTPLHVAAYWNRADVVKLLVARGADVKKTDRWGSTALHRAAASGYGDGRAPGAVAEFADITRQLLAAGADPLSKTPDGLTAVELARRIKNRELVQLLTSQKRP